MQLQQLHLRTLLRDLASGTQRSVASAKVAVHGDAGIYSCSKQCVANMEEVFDEDLVRLDVGSKQCSAIEAPNVVER